MAGLNIFFKPLQLTLEHKMAVSLDHPDTFETTVLAQRYHGTDPTHGGSGKNAHGQPVRPDNLMAQLDCHFNNFLSAATNSNSGLKQLTTAMTGQYVEIKLSLDALATNPCNPAPAPGAHTRSIALPFSEKHTLEKRIKTL